MENRTVPKAKKRLVRLKEAAEYMSMSYWKIRSLVHSEQLPFLQEGEGPILIDERDLDKYIERNKRVPPHW